MPRSTNGEQGQDIADPLVGKDRVQKVTKFFARSPTFARGGGSKREVGEGIFGLRRRGSGDLEEAVGEPAQVFPIHPPISFLRSAGAVLEAI